jgi:hypothetical protein
MPPHSLSTFSVIHNIHTSCRDIYDEFATARSFTFAMLHYARASSYVLNAARDFLVSLIAKTFRSIAKQDLLQVERDVFLVF